MGKTSRKLNIVVFDYLSNWPEIKILEEQGHEIWRAIVPEDGKEFLIPASKFASADIILGPNCWLMDRDHKKYLNICLKAARLKKYGSSKKSKKVGDENEDDDLDDLDSDPSITNKPKPSQ